jgi:hypothetical protein
MTPSCDHPRLRLSPQAFRASVARSGHLGEISGSEELLRIDHNGRAANPVAVTDALEDVFTIALGRRPHAGVEGRQLVAAQRLSLEAWDAALDAEGDNHAANAAGHTADQTAGHTTGHGHAARRGLARIA